MVPIWIIAVFAAILTYFMALFIPQQEAMMVEFRAQKAAAQYLGYSKTVEKYIGLVPPTASGTIVRATLVDTPTNRYQVSGYTIPADSVWNNYYDMTAGKTYIYTIKAPADLTADELPPKTVDTISKKIGTGFFVGTKDAGTDHLFSLHPVILTAGADPVTDTGITLPADTIIPDNAVVIVKR